MQTTLAAQKYWQDKLYFCTGMLSAEVILCFCNSWLIFQFFVKSQYINDILRA